MLTGATKSGRDDLVLRRGLATPAQHAPSLSLPDWAVYYLANYWCLLSPAAHGEGFALAAIH